LKENSNLDQVGIIALTSFVLPLSHCNDTFIAGISSRNSEVIHAGIYYPANSLKAQLCVAGKNLLYEYVKDRDIPHNQCGKLIIASTEAEVPKLNDVLMRAARNGVEMRLLDSSDVKAMEPAVSCFKALYSPTTGIFDSHSFMLNLQGDAESSGAIFVYNCTVLSSTVNQSLGNLNEGITLETNQGQISADIVINAAGLHSINFVENLLGYPRHLVPSAYYAKGNYFTLDSQHHSPFSRLVYPLPEAAGLGIHSTIDMNGSVRFGPDVEWIRSLEGRHRAGMSDNTHTDTLKGTQTDSHTDTHTGTHTDIDSEYQHRDSVPKDYTVDAMRSSAFFSAIKKYWPDVPEHGLVPAYSGIRPKLHGPSGPQNSNSCDRSLTDFVIDGPDAHGVKGLVNLFGIESPGLTSSLAIAEHISKILRLED
jgi:L-2-hydroxyglutarate oxidase LhgO